MKFIDLHCDTASKLYYEKGKNIKQNDFSVDIEKLKQGNAMAQFFALFICQGRCDSPLETCNSMLDNLLNELNKNSDDIKIAFSYDDILKNSDNEKISAMITIEEGEAIEGNMENLYRFYNKGVRLMTLTWNYENSIGYPHIEKSFQQKGLKDFGIDVVQEMNRLKMIIDVSHISDGGFYDVAKFSKKPFVASHSNARTITGHSRNMTDHMIKVLANSGGIMGINFAKDFLGTNEVSSIDDMTKHIKHIRNVGGIDVIALGSDFDGIDNKVEIEDASQMDKLYKSLMVNGFKESEIEKIFYKNALRLIKETL